MREDDEAERLTHLWRGKARVDILDRISLGLHGKWRHAAERKTTSSTRT